MNPPIVMKNLKNKINEKDNERNELLLRLIDFWSGSIAGGVQVIVSQPFDTVKVKEQTFPKMYKNMIDCFVMTYRNEGLFRGLYAGTLPALLSNVGENAILFAAYESCRNFVARIYGIKNVDNLPIIGEALAGGLGSFFSTFIVCPTELIKCRMQSMKELKMLAIAKNESPPPNALTMGKLINRIYVTNGLTGFYRGLTATFLREIPGHFCFFGCYEAIKELCKAPEQKRTDVGPLITIFASGFAGIMLWVITFPADVIKSRIQVNDLKSDIFSVGRHIVRNDGYRALYHGLVPSIIRTIPATATLFLVYEFVKKKLNNVLNEEIKRRE